jgi:hypothetical protein
MRSRLILVSTVGLAAITLLGVGLGFAAPGASPIPTRPGVYAVTGGALSQLSELRHADRNVGLVWDEGPAFDGSTTFSVASSEIEPCLETRLDLYQVVRLGRETNTGWPSLKPENGAVLRKVPAALEHVSGERNRGLPAAWMIDEETVATVCRLSRPSKAPLSAGQYLLWNGKVETRALMRALPFRVK